MDLQVLICVLIENQFQSHCLYPFPVESNDYLLSPLVLQYPTQLCSTLTIIDDQILEEPNENFTIAVIGTSIVGAGEVLGLPPPHMITIEDDEGRL